MPADASVNPYANTIYVTEDHRKYDDIPHTIPPSSQSSLTPSPSHSLSHVASSNIPNMNAANSQTIPFTNATSVLTKNVRHFSTANEETSFSATEAAGSQTALFEEASIEPIQQNPAVSRALLDATANTGGGIGIQDKTVVAEPYMRNGRVVIPDEDDPIPTIYTHTVGDWKMPNLSPFQTKYYYSHVLDAQSHAFIDRHEHRFEEIPFTKLKSHTKGANLHHSFLQYGHLKKST